MSALDRVELFRRLVAIDSTSSRSNLEIVDLLSNLLDRPGVRLHRHATADGQKANLIAFLGPPNDGSQPSDESDQSERRGLVLSGHTDVVPALESDWETDPFTLVDRGDRWVGRGSADMKGFLALATDLACRADLGRLTAPLVLLFTHDEEVGTLGAQRLARDWSGGGWPEPLPRACLIGEPTSLRAVRFHKGHLRIRVTAHGVAAHSSLPQLGKNAIEAMGRAIPALVELRHRLESERAATSRYFPEAPFVTLNLGMISGGAAVNVVADRCDLDIGVRPLPGMDAGTLRRRVADALQRGNPGDLTIEILGDSPPLACPEHAAVAREFAHEFGDDGERGVPFASDGGPLQALGLETVIYGPGSIGVAHRANEWLPKAEFETAGEVLDHMVGKLCHAPPPEASTRL